MDEFDWLIGERVRLHLPKSGAAASPDGGAPTVEGIIREVRDDSPWEEEQHIRVVVEVDGQLIDTSKSAVELQ